jgi:hypothetical protein
MLDLALVRQQRAPAPGLPVGSDPLAEAREGLRGQRACGIEVGQDFFMEKKP